MKYNLDDVAVHELMHMAFERDVATDTDQREFLASQVFMRVVSGLDYLPDINDMYTVRLELKGEPTIYMNLKTRGFNPNERKCGWMVVVLSDTTQAIMIGLPPEMRNGYSAAVTDMPDEWRAKWMQQF